jgi:transcriptional regulator with XRE-family HTH domain
LKALPIDTDIDELLGLRIAKRRKHLGMTIREMGRRSGLSPSFLSEAEKGQRGMSVLSLCRIAYALETPAPRLLRGLGGGIV